MQFMIQHRKGKFFTGWDHAGKPMFGRRRHAVKVPSASSPRFNGPEFDHARFLPVLEQPASAQLQDAAASARQCLATK